MGLKVSDLTSYLRLMLMDTNANVQEFSDAELTNYLEMVIKLENSILGDLGCKIQLNNDDPNDIYWEFVTDPQDWLQVFYCLASCLRMQSWKNIYSFDDGVNKMTANNIKDVVNNLKESYNAILQEHKYSGTGYVFTTWDDYFSRPNLILDEINKGFR